MDLVGASKFFDTTWFDSFNAATNQWSLKSFKGQVKKADTFVSIWNRPTRKRMLYTHPGQEPPTSIMRVSGTTPVFFVGMSHPDFTGKSHYRNVQSIHEAKGLAAITRLDRYTTPSTVVERRSQGSVYLDLELRSIEEDLSRAVNHYGHYFAFMARDANVKKHDVLVLNGLSYFIIDLYNDSGFLSARVEQRQDERQILAYTQVLSNAYNHATQAVVETTAPHTVVARVSTVRNDQLPNSDILSSNLRVLLDPYFSPGLVPKPNDRITIGSQAYTVETVRAEPNNTEFDMIVRL